MVSSNWSTNAVRLKKTTYSHKTSERSPSRDGDLSDVLQLFGLNGFQKQVVNRGQDTETVD